jgi:lipoprotein-anchoring transpeptidase ErfK/SrfK
MLKKFISLFITIVISTIFIIPVSAETLNANDFDLHVKIPDTYSFSPFRMQFNLFTEGNTWIANKGLDVSEPGTYIIKFPVKYEIGIKFKISATAGISEFDYYGLKFQNYEQCLTETYAYRDENGELHICDDTYIVAKPLSATYEYKVEKFVNDRDIKSETDYLIWVSKANFKVNVFELKAGKWKYVKDIHCSIGAVNTPTVTGEFVYHQQQSKWQYDGYYVGPIMRFYKGYAIHTTLINNNGTDRDARVGKIISHGCVRVRPADMDWLINFIPLNTKVFVTNE